MTDLTVKQVMAALLARRNAKDFPHEWFSEISFHCDGSGHFHLGVGFATDDARLAEEFTNFHDLDDMTRLVEQYNPPQPDPIAEDWLTEETL